MDRSLGTGGSAKWTPDDVAEAIRRWNSFYGQPPAAGEWNPSMARRLGHTERVNRFYADRWPNYRTVVKLFGGWNEAIRAAGLVPRPRGGRAGTSRARSEAAAPSARPEVSKSPVAPRPKRAPQPMAPVQQARQDHSLHDPAVVQRTAEPALRDDAAIKGEDLLAQTPGLRPLPWHRRVATGLR